MTVYPEALARPALEALLTCLSNENAQNPVPASLVSYRLGVTGDPLTGTIDDECCDGLAWLRFSQMIPSWGAPAPNTTSVRCALAWSVEVEIGIWRCVPIGDAQSPPTVAQWLGVQNQMFDDTKTLRATACCFSKPRDPGSVVWGAIAPKSDPQGGCFGVSMFLTIDLFGKGS